MIVVNGLPTTNVPLSVNDTVGFNNGAVFGSAVKERLI